MAQKGQERSALIEQCGQARTRTAELRHTGEDTDMLHAKISHSVQRRAASSAVFSSLCCIHFNSLAFLYWSGDTF